MRGMYSLTIYIAPYSGYSSFTFARTLLCNFEFILLFSCIAIQEREQKLLLQHLYFITTLLHFRYLYIYALLL